MNDQSRRDVELLLDWHLRQLPEDQRAALEDRMRVEPELQASRDQLGSLLRTLDLGATVAVPPQLADRVLARVELTAERSNTAARSRREGLRSFAWRYREPIAIAACLVALIGVIAPVLAEFRHRAQRVVCADRLASLFGATALYQESFAGSLPYAGGRGNAAWLPSGPSDRAFESNSRHAFLLVKSEFGVRPEHFVCPSDERAEPAASETLADHTDFPGSKNVTYNALNMSGPRPLLRPARTVAYMGDPNPLFVQARFDATIDADHANSPVHRGRGQTVLSLDGAATWQKSPLFGAGRDNVWLIDDLRQYNGTKAPQREDDTQLIPGFPEGRAAASAAGTR